jgi:imidazolonepropionase-like amidohydrolase
MAPLITQFLENSDWKGISFPRLLLHNFKLFNGLDNKLHEDQMLLVEGGIIKNVDRVAELAQFGDYKIYDLNGKTLMPGLIDNHVHISVPLMFRPNVNFFKQMNQQIVNNFRSCVMNGVTTVRDVGGFPKKINKYHNLSEKNEIPGPRVISSLSPIASRRGKVLGAPEQAPYFTNPALKWLLGGNYAERPQTVEEIREASERMISLGAQLLKSLYQEHSYSYCPKTLPNHTDEGYRAILEIGRKHGLKCALHEPFVSGFQKGVDLGFNTLEHMPMDALIPEPYIEKFINQGMAIMPTLMVYGNLFQEEDILNFIETRGRKDLVPEAVMQMQTWLKESLIKSKKEISQNERKSPGFDRQYIVDMHPNMVKNLERLHRMGATIGAGTDLGGSPIAIFGRYTDEIRRYVNAGISNFDALRMATSINANILGMGDKIGSIKNGAYADLIAVDGNPLVDIRTLDAIGMIMKGGLFLKAEGLLPV